MPMMFVGDRFFRVSNFSADITLDVDAASEFPTPTGPLFSAEPLVMECELEFEPHGPRFGFDRDIPGFRGPYIEWRDYRAKE